KGAIGYLAKAVGRTVEELMPRIVEGMNYLASMSSILAGQQRFVQWFSPTGFPVCNRYPEIDYETIKLPGDGGGEIRFRVGTGAIPGTAVVADCVNGLAPNFIHSLDAAHLVRVINACVAADPSITDLLAVHDCFYCLAPDAVRVNRIIRRE